MIEEAGFEAVYLSGAAFSAGVLALPDVGLFTLTELAQQVDYMTSRVAIPVIVDADTGFGDAVNVERTIAELEAAGAAAIQLEDQVLPKRCGHLSGKSLVDDRRDVRQAAGGRRGPSRRQHWCSSAGPTRGPSRASTTPSIGPSDISTPAPIGSFPKR